MLQIEDNSPCVNNGKNSHASHLSEDISGNSRIQNTVIDIGAFETNSNYNHYIARFEFPMYSITEDIGTWPVVVKLNKIPSSEVSIPFTIDGNMHRGANQTDKDFYIENSQDELIFAEGNDEAIINITINNDNLCEGNEFVIFNLGNNVNVNGSVQSKLLVQPNDMENVIAYYDAYDKSLFDGSTKMNNLATNGTFFHDGLHGDELGSFNLWRYSASAWVESPNDLPVGNVNKSISVFIKVMPDKYNRETVYDIVGFGETKSNKSFRIQIDHDRIKIFSWQSGWAISDFLLTNNNIIDGEWHNIVATYDGNSKTKVYVDGNIIGINNTKVYDTGNGPINIGHVPGISNETFPGYVDEFRIYNKTISQSEIDEINDYITIE